jgi:hypothetical protein
MADSPWRLDGNRAELRLASSSGGGLLGRLRVDRPGDGLRVDLASHGATDSQGAGVVLFSLAVHAALAAQEVFGDVVEDCYVRGRDLVITYGETPRVPLRYQVYWRAIDDALLGDFARGNAAGRLAGLDLILSAQTSVLDIDPTALCWSTTSATTCQQLYDGQAFRPLPHATAAHEPLPIDAGAPKCFLAQLAGELSLAQMVHSTDEPYSHTAVTAGGWPAASRVGFRHSLFRQPLEKGVILRGRLRAMFLSGESMAVQAQSAAARRQFESSPIPLTV